jgi:phosphoribosylanthranilate isomerase
VSTRVKICGITNSADALVAKEMGVDAVGFVFSEQSPRGVTIPVAAEISRQLPRFIIRAGVFVNAPADFVSRAIARCCLSLLQFHGDEPPEYCTQFGPMSMKAFRIRGAETLNELSKYKTDAWLLDAYSPEIRGGTGEKFDWDLAARAQEFGRPIFLAGGLTPENVAEAVRKVRPFGVDVSSGVEAAPGKKDHEKMRDFIRAAKTA